MLLKREKKGLLAASKATGCNNLFLITDHDNTQIIEDGRTITVIPAYIWLIDK